MAGAARQETVLPMRGAVERASDLDLGAASCVRCGERYTLRARVARARKLVEVWECGCDRESALTVNRLTTALRAADSMVVHVPAKLRSGRTLLP